MIDAIRVENLDKSYGQHQVLHKMSFNVVEGEIFSLLGVNGAGKTTTLECIEGLRKYNGGKIIINGKMGIQLQSASLPEHMKAMEAAKLFAKWNQVELDHGMLEGLGFKELAKKEYRSMSTGQKRRLHLALAMITDPDILFLDEPTAGLDVEARSFLHQKIRELKKQGKTIIMASHDMAEVESLSDRIGILREGKIAFIGTPDKLKTTIGEHSTIYIKSAEGVESFDAGNIRDAIIMKLEEYKEKGIEVEDIKIDRGTLEEHFINVSRGEQA